MFSVFNVSNFIKQIVNQNKSKSNRSALTQLLLCENTNSLFSSLAPFNLRKPNEIKICDSQSFSSSLDS